MRRLLRMRSSVSQWARYSRAVGVPASASSIATVPGTARAASQPWGARVRSHAWRAAVACAQRLRTANCIILIAALPPASSPAPPSSTSKGGTPCRCRSFWSRAAAAAKSGCAQRRSCLRLPGSRPTVAGAAPVQSPRRRSRARPRRTQPTRVASDGTAPTPRRVCSATLSACHASMPPARGEGRVDCSSAPSSGANGRPHASPKSSTDGWPTKLARWAAPAKYGASPGSKQSTRLMVSAAKPGHMPPRVNPRARAAVGRVQANPYLPLLGREPAPRR